MSLRFLSAAEAYDHVDAGVLRRFDRQSLVAFDRPGPPTLFDRDPRALAIARALVATADDVGTRGGLDATAAVAFVRRLARRMEIKPDASAFWSALRAVCPGDAEEGLMIVVDELEHQLRAHAIAPDLDEGLRYLPGRGFVDRAEHRLLQRFEAETRGVRLVLNGRGPERLDLKRLDGVVFLRHDDAGPPVPLAPADRWRIVDHVHARLQDAVADGLLAALTIRRSDWHELGIRFTRWAGAVEVSGPLSPGGGRTKPPPRPRGPSPTGSPSSGRPPACGSTSARTRPFRPSPGRPPPCSTCRPDGPCRRRCKRTTRGDPMSSYHPRKTKRRIRKLQKRLPVGAFLLDCNNAPCEVIEVEYHDPRHKRGIFASSVAGRSLVDGREMECSLYYCDPFPLTKDEAIARSRVLSAPRTDLAF